MLADLHVPCSPVDVTSLVYISLIRMFVKVVEGFGYLLTRGGVSALHGALFDLF
jgi:hypothetical protein